MHNCDMNTVILCLVCPLKYTRNKCLQNSEHCHELAPAYHPKFLYTSTILQRSQMLCVRFHHKTVTETVRERPTE